MVYPFWFHNFDRFHRSDRPGRRGREPVACHAAALARRLELGKLRFQVVAGE